MPTILKGGVMLDPDLDDMPNEEDYLNSENNVVGPSDIDRQLGIVKYHEKSLNEIKRIKLQRIDEINRWAERKRKRIQSKIDWHIQGMKHYLSVTKEKRIDLPNGKIYKKKQQPRYIWPEPESREMRGFIAQYGGTSFVKVNATIDKNAVKKQFKSDGVIPDGIDIELDLEEKFHYNTNDSEETMIDPWDVPDRIPANDEPELAYDRPSREIDEDREHEEYIQRQLEEEEREDGSK